LNTTLVPRCGAKCHTWHWKRLKNGNNQFASASRKGRAEAWKSFEIVLQEYILYGQEHNTLLEDLKEHGVINDTVL
jgi:hypothetical protein